jgi:predicted Zn-dependent protease
MKMRGRRLAKATRLAALAAVLALAFASGCAVNPATGKRQIMLVSESDEIEMGRQSDQAVVATMGLYDDGELQAYIQRVGRELAASSERPDLPWTFRVIDDPVVNAFALPGGYVYVTRGILAYLDSEAQLAAVMGHEIGHVTARHGANQMSKQQLAQIGLQVGAMASSDVARYGSVAESSLGLLFLKHSRDDEDQADDLGLRYMDRVGYDPRPMPRVYAMLKQVGDAQGAGTIPNWMSTHPEPADREQRMNQAVAALNEDFSDRKVRRNAYLDRIDGMVFGENPREGFFEGNNFLHPDMQFHFAFPPGWRTVNERSAVFGTSQGSDATVQITAASQQSADEALRAFLAQEAVATGAAWRDSIGGAPCASRRFHAATGSTNVRGIVAFVEHRGSVFRLLGYTSDAAWDGYAAAVESSLGSFRNLTDREALAVQPERIRIATVDHSASLRAWAAREDSAANEATLALINQVPTGSNVVRGKRYKLVDGE